MAKALLKNAPSWVFVFTLFAGTLAFSAATRSQEYLPTVVQNGDYRPLTFWGTVQLGSAYFTNPQKVAAVDVAYSYDGPEFTEGFKREALWSLAKQNKISFGITDESKNTISVVSLSELQKKFSVNSANDLDRVLSRDDVAVVANTSKLLGASSKSTVVKTSDPK